MNTTDEALAGLLTGNEETDDRLRQAFALGLRHGRAADRKGIQRGAQIQTTSTLLAALMRSQGIDLKAALVALQIPRKERKTYMKIFANKERRKRERNEKNLKEQENNLDIL